jgi:hypothetical protein
MNKSRQNKLVGHIACIRDIGNSYIHFVGKPEGKRPFGVHWHRWEDDIKMVFKEIV